MQLNNLRLFILLPVVAFLVSCESTAHGPNDPYTFGGTLVDHHGLPHGYDIYLGYAAVKGVRAGYSDLKNAASLFATKKCGANHSYELVDLKIRPHLFCCPARMAYFYANISCGNTITSPPIPMDKMPVSDAKNKCTEIGFSNNSTFFSDCVKELTR